MDNVEVYFGHSKDKKQWDEMQWGSADNYTNYKESRIIPIIGAQKIFSENITNFDSKQFSLDKKYQHNEYYKKKYKVEGDEWWFPILIFLTLYIQKTNFMGIGGTGTGFFPNRKNEKFIKDMKECMISLIRNNCNTHHLCKYVLLLKSKKSIDDCYSVSDDKIIEKDLINSIGDIYMYQLYVDEFIVTSFKFGNLSKKYNQVIKKILS